MACGASAVNRKPPQRDTDKALEKFRRAIDKSLADPRSNIPASEVFAALRLRHAQRAGGEKK
jgi:hypothetical protein